MLIPRMALRYWVYSVLAAIGAFAMVGGAVWLNQATSKSVSLHALQPTPEPALTWSKPPFENRQDVDVVLAIDFSGSMIGPTKVEATDPDALRLDAAELLVASLASDVFPRATRMSYIVFTTTVEILQPLSSVEDPQARKALIERLRKPRTIGDTNIVGTLRTAYGLLFPGGKSASTNIPALVLLTDGDPRGAGPDNDEAGIRKAVRDLTDRGTIIFAVMLRNPDPTHEPALVSVWRRIWKSMADTNSNVRYLEAQRATELEGIYNKIRARLVNEGARPGDRMTYDPKDFDAAVKMPPSLLQAHLLVSKPRLAKRLDIVAPDGTSFSVLAQRDKRNEVLVTDLYHRYRIYKPLGGNWKIVTDTTEPIYYLLNSESLFSARPALASPYIGASSSTQLPLMIVDENGRPSDKAFSLEASLLRNIIRPDGAIIEEEIPLKAPQRQPNGVNYLTQLTPDMIGTDNYVTLQVSGTATDGTLVNVSMTRLTVAPIPTGVVLQVPNRLVCSGEKASLWPPALRCSNVVTATMRVQGGEQLQPDSLAGMLFAPGEKPGMPMLKADRATLQQAFGPLETAGSYSIVAEASGKLGDNMVWKEQAESNLELLWPPWVEQWRHQLPIGAVLLAICALWKPVIIALLLPALRFLRLGPRGFYAMPGENYSDAVYRTAVQRRKLFALTVGRWAGRSLDIHTEEECPERSEAERRDMLRLWAKIEDRWADWWCKQPLGRLVAVPFRGLYAETGDGFEQAPDQQPLVMRVGKSSVLVCQSDWTDKTA